MRRFSGADDQVALPSTTAPGGRGRLEGGPAVPPTWRPTQITFPMPITAAGMLKIARLHPCRKQWRAVFLGRRGPGAPPATAPGGRGRLEGGPAVPPTLRPVAGTLRPCVAAESIRKIECCRRQGFSSVRGVLPAGAGRARLRWWRHPPPPHHHQRAPPPPSYLHDHSTPRCTAAAKTHAHTHTCRYAHERQGGKQWQPSRC